MTCSVLQPAARHAYIPYTTHGEPDHAIASMASSLFASEEEQALSQLCAFADYDTMIQLHRTGIAIGVERFVKLIPIIMRYSERELDAAFGRTDEGQYSSRS